MPEEREKVLTAVAEEVMGKFALMFFDPAGKDDISTPEAGLVKAEVRFAGGSEGCMAAVTTEDFCRILAENATGGAAASGYDALKELLNLACGVYLAEAYGGKGDFRILTPDAGPAEKDEWEKAMKASDAAMIVEDCPLGLLITIDGE